MDNNQMIRDKLLNMRRELVALQEIADKDDSVDFDLFIDLQRVIAQIDTLFYYRFDYNFKEKLK